ncbi:uncharacterized protein At4g38062 [Rosa chinensis]|uniref:uncharacterized protein At4g38062 n=1 Tax=Rosa chinensis TaxID=74649 RepID=UPI000D08DD80|nr:uncharacterized protein At4g38062 [Rosa chinensis]
MQKNMDSVYAELDEVKAELEKLRTEYKSKAELSENLRRAHNEQLSKVQEASLKIEKQAQELNENAEKISAVQQMCDDLKCSLKDKESMIQHLRAANDRLRVDCDEKYRKLEETNRVLALALDEANERKMDEEQTIRAYKEEIQGLKGRLSDSQKKCLEVEKKANASKELRERDEMIRRVEEENRKVQDQLKWKKEQFRHLEEAHEKLRDQFKESKKEWEREKSSLLDEICSLQTKLDSQTRISDDLQKQLKMCNHALAHEESRRKRLEVQVSEFQTRFTSDSFDSEDEKSQLERLTAERDKEIASLRQSLSTKATLHKEMEYQAGKLQQENEELRMSLKELQEAQIQSAPGSPSLAKLRSKLKRLEQMHRDSVADHRAKEDEWSSQLENMTVDLNNYKSELENKDAAITGLRLELEQMQRDLTSDLRAKEYECSSQFEKMKDELNICKYELESKDAALKELNMEMEQMHKACTTNGAEDAEWSSQLEKMADDVKSYISELERKDAMITELKMEMEQMHKACTTNGAKDAEWSSQLEKMADDVKSYISELERKDAMITELKMEMEQMHRDCTTYRAKETEWSSQLEKMTGDLESHISELERKDAAITALKMEMEQMHGDCTTYQAKEAEWSSQLEKMTGDLKSHISELERKDAVITELKTEMEQMHRDCTTYRAKETDWSSQLEKLTGDVKSYISELERKDAVITELKMEMEQMHRDYTINQAKETEWSSQLEKMTGDVKTYISKLECKDAAINELKMEMEQMHRDYTINREKETEWSSQLEKMTGDVNVFKSELECKDAAINELKMELEACHSLTVQLKLQNEELSVMLLVLKLGISEAQLKISNERSEMVLLDKEKEEYISLLMQQVEMKNAALVIAQAGIEEECEKAAFLSRRIEALDLIEKEQLLMQEELDRYKEMLEDSSKHELCLKQQLLQIESVLERERREVNDALERANTELAEKISEGSEIEMELHIWKSITENLRTDLEVSLAIRKELEASLLAEVDVGETIKQENKGLLCVLEEKDKTVENLQQQIVLLEQKLKRTDADAENAGSEQIEAAMSLEKLQNEVSQLEHESLMKEFTGVLLAQIGAERLFEHEKEKLIQLVEQKYQRVNDLMQLVESLENKFNCSVVSLSSQLAEKQAEINLIHEAWEDITAAQIMAAVENEEKKSVIAELEVEICSLQTKLESQQKSLYDSQQRALEFEAELKTKELEAQKRSDQMKTKLRNSDALIEELKSERRNVLEDVIKLSSESISQFSSTDKQLRGMLEEMVLSFENQGPKMDLEWTDEFIDPEKENVSTPTMMKKCEVISDLRSPFRDLNT